VLNIVPGSRHIARVISLVAVATFAWTAGCGDDAGGSFAAACKANCAPAAACGGPMTQAECQSECDSIAEIAEAFGFAECTNAGAAWFRCLSRVDDCDEREAVNDGDAGNACEAEKQAENEACSF